MNVALLTVYVNKILKIASKDFCGNITLNFQFGNVTNMNVSYSWKPPAKKEKK